MIVIDWGEAKRLISLGISYRYVKSSSSVYHLFLSGEGSIYECKINIDDPKNADQIDFEDNYKTEKPFSDADSDGTKIVTLAPFANKKLPQGSLFKRVHGETANIAANSTGNIDLVVPYNLAKFNGAEIINCALGDTVDFEVLDNAAGTISGVPNFMLNQFGFNVRMPQDFYKNTSEYDADIILGMTIRCKYTNNSNAARDIYINIEMHEVKP